MACFPAHLTSHLCVSDVVKNILNVDNPDADCFIKINADNSAETRTPSEILIDLGLNDGTAGVAAQALFADEASHAGTASMADRVEGPLSNVNFPVFVLDTVPYYGHVSGGVLTFTDTP